MSKKQILLINGSAAAVSANAAILNYIISSLQNRFDCVVYEGLKALPHFDPELSVANTPAPVLQFREQILAADAIVFCTPEYVFSVPAGLKNALEWCVATTVFQDKPVALITAAASGVKAHESLQLLLGTLMARTSEQATLLLSGIKGKLNEEGRITDASCREALDRLIEHFAEGL